MIWCLRKCANISNKNGTVTVVKSNERKLTLQQMCARMETCVSQVEQKPPRRWLQRPVATPPGCRYPDVYVGRLKQSLRESVTTG